MKITLTTIALLSGFFLCSSFAVDAKSPTLTLTVSRDTPYASVIKVLDACRAAGLSMIKFSTIDSESQSITLLVSEDMPYDSISKVIDACQAADLKMVNQRTAPPGK